MSFPTNNHEGEPVASQGQEKELVSIMGPEINIHSIRALEKQIEEGKGDIIKLKRDRNSLLNISIRTPPEILGYIFAWNLVRKRGWYFDGLQTGSYNFLLVCHHWFNVASRTPELWSFLGNTLQDWKKRHHRSGAAPLDLVLLEEDESDQSGLFDEPLQEAVRRHVMQDTVRQVHLVSGDSGTLVPIISSLTPNDEGGRNENIESIIWHSEGFISVDASDFFARSRLSRLRLLKFHGNFWISSWDRLASGTTLLTTLSLEFITSDMWFPIPIVTASQLFSILTSNPNLRELRLFEDGIPEDVDGYTFQAPLRHLKTLSLLGDFRRVFGLLSHLILLETLDQLDLEIFDTTEEDVSQTLAPYIRDHFRRDTRFQDRLSVNACSDPSSASISVSTERTKTKTLTHDPTRISIVVDGPDLPPGVLEHPLLNLIALVPLEHIKNFHAGCGTELTEELFLMMPNIETLCISNPVLSEGFLQPKPGGPHSNTKLLPSLRSLCLEDVPLMEDDNRGHLIMYLAHQTSDNQAISLEMIGGFSHGCPEAVTRGIKALVKEFTYVSRFRGPPRGFAMPQ